MAILITGGAGYIGSVTTELLRARGERVVVLDNLSRGHRDAVAPEVPFYQGDAGNRELITRVVQEHDVDACIHFAAFAYVGESVSAPALYYENNVEQGIRLLGALVQADVRQFVERPSGRKDIGRASRRSLPVGLGPRRSPLPHHGPPR